jgi:hypothetical protein
MAVRVLCNMQATQDADTARDSEMRNTSVTGEGDLQADLLRRERHLV